MGLQAKNEYIQIEDWDCDYITFGSGEKPLIMLTGVGDGFQTAKGIAVPFAFAFRRFAKDFKVYVFSRRRVMPEGFTTADMSDDIAAIMREIGLESAYVYGVSQGGMIAQQLAIRYPKKVRSLVLAVTAPKSNPTMIEALEGWLEMVKQDDYAGIMRDTAIRSYTGKYLRRGLRMNKLLSLAKPKDYSRFRILCESCLEHDCYDFLGAITCPTLVIGAEQDQVLSGEASRVLAEQIPHAELYMYEGYSHGVYEQAKDFNERVINWLLS